MKWWAYIHPNKTLQVKRFFSMRDLQAVKESPFVERLLPVVDADNREDARKEFVRLLKHEEVSNDG